MTPQEQLKAIERSVRQEDGHYNMNDNFDDIIWLIRRVEQLEKAISDHPACSTLIKALETMP